MSEMDKDILKKESDAKEIKKSNKTKNNSSKEKEQSKKEENKKNTSSTYTKKRNRKRTRKKTNNGNNNNAKSKTDNKNLKSATASKNKNTKIEEKNKKEITKKSNNSRKKRLKKNRFKNNNKRIIIFVLVLILVLISLIVCYKINYDKQKKKFQDEQRQDIINHYNEYVTTNKEANIYKLENGKYKKAGKISAKQELTLYTKELTYKDEYLKIITFEDEYYIYYEDLDIIEELSSYDNRYKKYIVFNKNIITKDKTNFYDEEGNLVYAFNSSFELPIIINKENIYGVEFNNRLLYIKKEDVSEVKESNNTELTNTNGIAVLNYHFFYDETKASERNDCNQIICHSKSGFTKHLEYIKNNNIFTPTMKEFEMYLNKEINLPKSVMITIDDGWRTQIATELLEKYQLNGTIFLITSWFKEIDFLNDLEYIEYHSHGDNIHNQGDCPGGQGGAIKCLEKSKLLQDLNLSREKLNGTTAFCYPFYEYNSYSISVLKEAGFTLAFAGGFKKATPNTDKYQIPRYVMYDSTTVNQLKSYIG